MVDSVDPLLGFSIANPLGNPDRDAIGIDNLSLALVAPNAVPVPASFILLISALLGTISVVHLHHPSTTA